MRSAGTSAMPSSRLVEATPTCSRSISPTSRSSGPLSASTYSSAAVICPSETQPCGVAVGADQQRDHARGVERDVDDGEEQVAQRHRVALGLGRDVDVVVAGLHAQVGQPERLDGAGALDRLGQRGVDPGVRRALGDVALRGALEVAAHLRSRTSPITSRDGTASSTEFSSIATTESATVRPEMIAWARRTAPSGSSCRRRG